MLEYLRCPSAKNDQLGWDDRLVEFYLQAGLVDKSWILFDSGACANCCPEWLAPDYPVLPLNESAPSLRSLSRKTLDVQGRKIVQLDCGNGHSLNVQFYVCTGIPLPLVSDARLLLQDFWTVMAKDYLALIDPFGNPFPIMHQGILIYLCPTVIPYAVADAARMAASHLPEVMDGIENELGSVELRGVTDMNDGSTHRIFQIGALIAAAQEVKAKEGYRWDMWEVNESNLKLIRIIRLWRNEMLDPRIKLANKSPVPITGKWSRLTGGERVTFKQYKDGSTVTVRDDNFFELSRTRSKDPMEWRGRVEFGLKHKLQLRHMQKTAPRPYDPMIGRDKPKVANDEIVEFRKADDSMEVVEKANEEPEVIDRQIRVSRNVEEHELENALRSLPQHGSRMKELLLQVFNLEDPETAAPPLDTASSLLDKNAS